MGTHPIFESDFDCLTDSIMSYGGVGNEQPSQLQTTQAQVQEVVGIMKGNVERVLERDQKLSQLDDRADALQQGASQFETQAAKLKRKYWWRNCKMWIILIAIGLIVVVIIVASQSKQQNPQAGGMAALPPAQQQPVQNIPAVQNSQPAVQPVENAAVGMQNGAADQ